MRLFRSLTRGYQNSQPETSRANQEDDSIESQAIARLSVLGEIELEQKRFMHCNGDCLLLTTTETTESIYFEIIERGNCHALLAQPEICGKPYHNTVALSP